ncbi:YncE family protein [Streptomyces inhibens]|uniref:YncE family protein n=1 Tax=Streptomyces inhibens TaxID=2293571 RepID=UPI00402ACF85
MTPTTAGSPGDLLAVVSQTGPTVTFFDAATHERLDVLEVPPQPHELCFDPDSRLLYCTNTYRSGFYRANEGRAHELTVIDVDTRTVVDILDTAPDHAPHGLALDRERARLYVSVEATDTEPGGVLIIDTRTRARLGRIPTMAPARTGSPSPPTDGTATPPTRKPRSSPSSTSTAASAPAVSPSPAAKAWPSPPTGSTSTSRPQGRLRRPALGTTGHPRHRHRHQRDRPHAPHPRNRHARPCHRHRDAARRRTAPGHHPGGPLGSQLPGVLSVFAAGTLDLIGEVEVGRFPLTITSSPDGRLGYVSGNLSSTVTVVDLTALRPIATLEVDRADISGAHGLAYIESPQN